MISAARACLGPAALSSAYTRILVSRLNGSALMDRVAIKRTCRERPAGGHPRPRARQRRFLLRGQAAGRALDRDDTRHGRAVARDGERRTALDLADDAG